MKTTTSFEDRLNQFLSILSENKDSEYTSAVGIVQDRDKWLLGLSKDTDDRNNKWVHPGGHIKRGESPKRAAEREVYEETGIRCKAVGEPFSMPGRKGVAFVHCKVTSSGQELDKNHEFAALGFFKKKELKSLKLYKNVTQLINRVSN